MKTPSKQTDDDDDDDDFARRLVFILIKTFDLCDFVSMS